MFIAPPRSIVNRITRSTSAKVARRRHHRWSTVLPIAAVCLSETGELRDSFMEHAAMKSATFECISRVGDIKFGRLGHH